MFATTGLCKLSDHESPTVEGQAPWCCHLVGRQATSRVVSLLKATMDKRVTDPGSGGWGDPGTALR